MDDHHNTQHQTYPSNHGDGSGFYTPSEHQYQSSAHDYATQRPHDGQGYQHAQGGHGYDAYPNHSEGYNLSPTVYHPQVTEAHYEYLGPSSAMAGANHHGHDETRLSPYYEPRGHGSNAEYYEHTDSHERSQSSHRRSSSTHDDRERDERVSDEGGGERGLAGALVGGATGYYLGHKKSHGILGAIGGAILGNLLENKIDERRDEGHGHNHESHHGRRRRRHHHHHHGSRSRSRSRSGHSHRSRDSSS
ncbi:hypothetical protein BJY04DRAFT_177668 [Aspergillus karnatakaensis]|uniref:uncharacterized protein n=1 Tax=Aspergillus karnatakaensis TaxID=1810916 RepID=UPI003CCE1499